MSDDIELRPKSSVWRRPLRLAPGGMFKALGSGFINGVTQNWAGVGKNALDVVGAVGLDTEVGEQAGVLVTRALGRALATLLDPYKMHFHREVATDVLGVARAIDDELQQLELVIDHRFLEHPRGLEIIAVFQTKILDWIAPLVGTSEGERALKGRSAQSIAGRLPEHFVYALRRELVDRPGDYGAVFDELDGPFASALRRERSWELYRAWLDQDLEGALFGDTFSLVDVYVPARAYHLERVAEDQQSRPGRGRRGRHDFGADADPQQQRRVVGWLRETLDAWMRAGDSDDVVRVISGGPGAGKSSFARMYTRHRLREHGSERTLYVALHRLDLSLSFAASLEQLCQDSEVCPRLELDGEGAESSLLLVLDGLDELSKAGKVGTRLAYEFVDALLRKLDASNHGRRGQPPRLRALICGRPIAVQDVQAHFKGEGQVLHLLPYCLTNEERANLQERIWVDEDGLLTEDLRDRWWQGYGEASGRGDSGLPEVLRGKELFEVTREPLLGYLLARVYEQAETDPEQLTSLRGPGGRNEIYRRLIEGVYEREWGTQRGGGHPLLAGFELEDFSELLEDMALSAWRHEQRVTSVAALEALPGGKERVDHVQALARHCDDVGQLFATFYFRRRGGGSSAREESFEFTHKSFAEYLVARRLVAEVEFMAKELASPQKGRPGRRRSQRLGPPELLTGWLEVCGRAAINNDLLPYLQAELNLREAAEPGIAAGWQQALAGLIEHVLVEGSPCERLKPRPNFQESCRRARNAEEALLVLAWACSMASRELTQVCWPERGSFGNWWKWLNHRSGEARDEVFVVRTCMKRMNLEEQNLGGANLVRANLVRANLVRANFEWANLLGTNLEGANLERANLNGAFLKRTYLGGANLEGAYLRGANLERADLERAYLRGADLGGAYLRGADLEWADLRGADLRGADLRGAKLKGANLEGADLERADLERANLEGAKLEGANLKGVNLKWAYLWEAALPVANLSWANLSWANLSEANLSGANLSEANLSEANLSGANLSWANLEGANLEGANLERVEGLTSPLGQANDH